MQLQSAALNWRANYLYRDHAELVPPSFFCFFVPLKQSESPRVAGCSGGAPAEPASAGNLMGWNQCTRAAETRAGLPSSLLPYLCQMRRFQHAGCQFCGCSSGDSKGGRESVSACLLSNRVGDSRTGSRTVHFTTSGPSVSTFCQCSKSSSKFSSCFLLIFDDRLTLLRRSALLVQK